MAKLIINSFLIQSAGDRAELFTHAGLKENSELDIEAKNVRDLIKKLDQTIPGIGDKLQSNIAVAIDGEIYPDPLLEPLDEECEVYFLPAIEGG